MIFRTKAKTIAQFEKPSNKYQKHKKRNKLDGNQDNFEIMEENENSRTNSNNNITDSQQTKKNETPRCETMIPRETISK